MLNISPNVADKSQWTRSLQQAFTNADALCSYLELSDVDKMAISAACTDFPLLVTREFAARMQKGCASDPLLLQVLPQYAETISVPGYSPDPLQENQQNPIPGLLHKYRGRVLVTLTGRCAIHCRYCFRRHFPYADNNPGSTGRQALIDYIVADASIEEVILSGGDPLIANDKLLQEFIDKIADIAHVTTVRIHSRLPVVIPTRITNELLAILANTRLHSVLVYHINHANEIDEAVIMQAKRLKSAGVTLLNQSVLLAGVNDSANTLMALSKRLFSAGILPYYLHLCDKTQGTAHFDVSLAKAQVIMSQLRAQCPGYLVPACVQEIAGELSKVPLPQS